MHLLKKQYTVKLFGCVFVPSMLKFFFDWLLKNTSFQCINKKTKTIKVFGCVSMLVFVPYLKKSVSTEYVRYMYMFRVCWEYYRLWYTCRAFLHNVMLWYESLDNCVFDQISTCKIYIELLEIVDASNLDCQICFKF